MTTVTLDQQHTLNAGLSRRIASAVIGTDRSTSLTLLRLVLGAVMLPHGLQKTMGWFGGYGFDATMGYFGSLGIPAFLGFLAIATESAGAIALIAGVGTRIAAFGVLSTMVVASTMHRANGFFMNWSGQQAGEGVEYHILAIAIALVLVARGAGRWSIDGALSGRDGEAR
jgi:putative oxidoreductase